MQREKLSNAKLTVVAIPARNEAANLADCLAALACQRDEAGAPIAKERFEVLIFANNCTDETASVVRRYAELMPHPVRVVEENLEAGHVNAGWARKRAMDLAANRLADIAPIHGLILTTDADSRVAPTWLAGTWREFDRGADCVAGYIDAISAQLLALGVNFLARGRLEDTYLRYLAEINARCDPRPHDPWPNHRVSSGASLAVTFAAYSAIGGLPPCALGEDSALTKTLDLFGFKVRHSMDVCVSTSCRFEGRALGGAADTMRYRHSFPDSPCDDEMEPALQATRRALSKGFLRGKWDGSNPYSWPFGLNFSREIANLFDGGRAFAFEDAWRIACDIIPSLKRGVPLCPSDLPRQIAYAKMIVQHLQIPVRPKKISPSDKFHREEWSEPAVSI